MPKPRKNPDDLNDNEKLFALRYVELGQNGTRAYMSVWPRSSADAAAVSANRLLNKPNLWAEIVRLRDEVASKHVMSAQEALREMTRIAGQDPQELVNPESGQYRTLREIPEDLRRCISSVERNRRGFKVTFWSKTEALKMVGKFHKILTDQIEVKGTITLAEKLARARKRTEKQ